LLQRDAVTAMSSATGWSLIGVVLLALLHIAAGRLHRGEGAPPRWLSAASGMSVAYVFIAMLVALFGCEVNPLELGHAKTSTEERPSTISLQRPADQEIERRLLGILSQVDGLHDVHVRVREGVVDLRGETDSLGLEQRAGAIASRLEGVVHVTNDIRRRSGLHGLFAPTWRTLRRIGRAGLSLLPQLSAAILVFVPFLLLALGLRRWRRPRQALGARPLTGRLARFAFRGALVITGLLLSLDVLGIMGIVGAVVGTLGLLGLVAGFVFKDWVASYFPGMMLGLHPPFKAGDLVQVGAYEGRVVRITPRVTVLMTTDGEEVRVPNAFLFHQTLINFSHHRERRLRIVMPLSPTADLRAAQELGRRALLGLHGVLGDPPPFMRTRALGRDMVEVEYFAWADQDAVNFRTVESRAKRVVLEALADGGVPLPEDSLVVRFGARAMAGGHGDEAVADQAEQLDQAFLDQQLDRARIAGGERDLLEEESAPPRAAISPPGTSPSR
jgi:small-conductance mechanosensitive channel